MKTTLLKQTGLLLAIGSLASCGTSSIDRTASSTTFRPTHWHKVRSQPPTYFPKGVSSGHPTDAADGMWVYSGDTAGTRYFIPVRGVDTNALVAEAMSTMTPERREQVRKGDNDLGGDFGDAVRDAVGGGLLGLGHLAWELDQSARRSGYEPKGEGMRR